MSAIFVLAVRAGLASPCALVPRPKVGGERRFLALGPPGMRSEVRHAVGMHLRQSLHNP